ncbi:retrovirus-related pol polyprotein from transposon TNT 1-94 [Tanacetum coccineum]
MTETIEQYMSKTRGNYGLGVVRSKINDKTHFELIGQYLKELRENTFSGSNHEDANKHIEKVLEIVNLFHIPEVTQDQVMLRVFPMSLTGAARHLLRNEPSGSITKWETLKMKFLNKYCPPARTAKKMEEEVILFYNGLNVPTRQICDSKGAIPTKTAADTKIAIQAMAEYSQKWHNETSSKAKIYAAQVGCELCKGPHYTNDCPQKEEGNTLKEAYYIQFGASYQPAGQYRVAGPGFYQRNNGNSSYPDRRQTLEESLTKFIAESAKRHEENSNIIKEIRASTDATIRNQGASIKTLEIQIGQMSKLVHLRYAVWDAIHMSYRVHSTKACFLKQFHSQALVDLGASVSVMPFSTYTNLGLVILSHTRLTIELADRTIKQPRGIVENVLVRIGKFIFPIDFIILDIPEDDDVPLILGRPFLSTAHSKIDVYKRKITLRAREEKLVFKSIKPATSLIRRVFMLKDIDLKTKVTGEDNESFDPLYGNYIKLNDLDMPLEPETIQDVNFEPIFVNEPETSSKCYKMKFSCTIGYKNVNTDFIPSLFVNLITKSFYYSIIKDKNDHEGKRLAGALIDIPIFVGKFSILTGFIIVDNDDVTSDVKLGMQFFTKYMSCQMIMKKFAHGDKCKRMMNE